MPIIRQYLYLLTALLISFSTVAQVSFDEGDVQSPLKKLHTSLYPDLKAPIKSFIHIIDKDTITKSVFDKRGNEILKYNEFGKGKPSYKYVVKFEGNLKTATQLFINDILQSINTYRYDKNKNLVEWKSFKVVYDKQAGTSTKVQDGMWITEYDKNNRINGKYSKDAAGVNSQSYQYKYDSLNRLVEIEQEQWKNKYEHNGRLVTRKLRIFKPDSSTYATFDYKYSNDSLLIASSDKDYTSEFTYDSLNALRTLLYKKKSDTTYKQIDFFYTNNQLTKADITTNNLSTNYAHPGFIFNTNYLYSFGKSKLYKMKMEFVYDKQKNVVEIKYFVKDEYKYSQYFIYEYY